MRHRSPSPSLGGGASYGALAAFGVLYAVLTWAWKIPAGVAVWYAGTSLLCFTLYVIDKSAAQAGRWRIAERTLLALGLVGGWPGAIVAQQRLRHKSRKPRFLLAFWISVLLNVAALTAGTVLPLSLP